MYCCGPKCSRLLVGMLLGSGLFAAGGMFFSRSDRTAESNNFLPVSFRPDATSMGKSISVATGWIDDEVEGLYVLDHLTGNLQCWVMNSRSGEVGGVFRGNVNLALGLEGKADPDYVIATGRFDFKNFRQGNLKYANCICYVGESSTGKILAYSFTFDPTTGALGQPQMGDLILIATIPFRDPTLLRD